MSLRVTYLKRERLRDSEFLLGVELVLGVGMMWDMLLHRQLHREAKVETQDAQMKPKVMSLSLFVVLCCWHCSNDISRLTSDTAVIRIWRLIMVVLAIPILVQS